MYFIIIIITHTRTHYSLQRMCTYFHYSTWLLRFACVRNVCTVDANGVDLTQMDRWYSQAGTPTVTVDPVYDAATRKLTLTMTQSQPTTPGQPAEEKQPLLIPIVVGLLDKTSGAEMVPSTVLKLTEATQTFTFDDVPADPVLSALRDFSAPVNLDIKGQSDADLIFLMAHDTDSFNRWDACDRFFTKLILSIAEMSLDDIKAGKAAVPQDFIKAIDAILEDAVVRDAI